MSGILFKHILRRKQIEAYETITPAPCHASTKAERIVDMLVCALMVTTLRNVIKNTLYSINIIQTKSEFNFKYDYILPVRCTDSCWLFCQHYFSSVVEKDRTAQGPQRYHLGVIRPPPRQNCQLMYKSLPLCVREKQKCELFLAVNTFKYWLTLVQLKFLKCISQQNLWTNISRLLND